jgi:hypothetical protein
MSLNVLSERDEPPQKSQLRFKKIMNIQMHACERSGTAMDVYTYILQRNVRRILNLCIVGEITPMT